MTTETEDRLSHAKENAKAWIETMAEIDRYTIRHLDTWLAEQINGDSLRTSVRAAMLAFISDDPEYWGAQSWWLVYDRAGCASLAEVR